MVEKLNIGVVRFRRQVKKYDDTCRLHDLNQMYTVVVVQNAEMQDSWFRHVKQMDNSRLPVATNIGNISMEAREDEQMDIPCQRGPATTDNRNVIKTGSNGRLTHTHLRCRLPATTGAMTHSPGDCRQPTAKMGGLEMKKRNKNNNTQRRYNVNDRCRLKAHVGWLGLRMYQYVWSWRCSTLIKYTR